MQYMMLIYSSEAPETYERLSEDEQQAIMGEYMAISGAPGVTGGAQLQPVSTATTVRVQDGRTLTTDGPFTETKEALGGYYLFEADDLDAAIELAARIPAARLGGSIEVRPWCSADRARLQGRVGTRPRRPDRLPRRLRSRRGSRPGGLRDRRRALAA
jgi:hypothetical protein